MLIKKTLFTIALLLLTIMAMPVSAEYTAVNERLSDNQFTIQLIDIQINPIFDPEDSHGWLYQTANDLHIETKPYVIKRLLPFKVGDTISERDVKEAERLLRDHNFLREAKILIQADPETGNKNLQVQTWENWTLFPTLNFNREGGNSDVGYGVKDDNLLGMGLNADIAYFSERDRSGYTLKLFSDAINDKHLRAGVTLSDNSDGEQYALFVDKPFYSLRDQWAAGVNANYHRQEVSIDANEILVNRFESNRQLAEVFYGYSPEIVTDGILRFFAGVTHDKVSFNPMPLTSVLPEDRDLTYPWLAFSFQQDKFVTQRNFYLLAKTEDLQLGWNHYVKLGYNLETSYQEKGWVWQLNSGYFGQFNQKHWYRYGLSGDGIHGDKDNSISYYSLFYEHFYRVNEFRTWYLKANYLAADNPYIDRPLVLGGERGLRGFPNEYQHGKKRWLLNLEKRFYPDINLYRLVDVGFVAFVDAGRNQGETNYLNQESGVLASAGVGIRLFLTRSSGRNVININVAQPINSDFVKDLDISIVVRTSF